MKNLTKHILATLGFFAAWLLLIWVLFFLGGCTTPTGPTILDEPPTSAQGAVRVDSVFSGPVNEKPVFHL